MYYTGIHPYLDTPVRELQLTVMEEFNRLPSQDNFKL